MDVDTFDRLARASASPERRRLLGSLIAGMATTVLPWSGRPAAAACKTAGKKCDKGKDCCGNARCKNGRCRCKKRFTNCDGKCKNLDGDEKHCGTCNRACDDGLRCCGGACVDRQSNPDHCGACNNACGIREGCANGTCVDIAGICEVGDDNCRATGTFLCSEDAFCRCARTKEGRVACGTILGSTNVCGECQSSADCAHRGPGAFCMDTADGEHCCDPANPELRGGICWLPCPITI